MAAGDEISGSGEISKEPLLSYLMEGKLSLGGTNAFLMI
jgi:hypothetical protein